jgi:hypothetical protein
MIANKAQEKGEIKTIDFKKTIAKVFQPSKDWKSIYKFGRALQTSYFNASKLTTEILNTPMSRLMETIKVATGAQNSSKSDDVVIAKAVNAEQEQTKNDSSQSQQKDNPVEKLKQKLDLSSDDVVKVNRWYEFFKKNGLIR